MLEFCTRGNPTHPPLIFLHGFLGSKEDWEEFFSFFEEEYYCIAFHLPGHGNSPYTSEIVTCVRQEILQKCGELPRCIGYSMGGRIALQMQEIFTSIACLSSHWGLSSEKEKEERLVSDISWAEKLKVLDFKIFLEQWYSQPLFHSLKQKKTLYSQVLSRRKTQDPQQLAKVLMQLSLAKQKRIETFTTPTTVFYGKEDCKYEKLYSRITCNVRCIPEAGHVIHLENATECASQIKEAFSRPPA